MPDIWNEGAIRARERLRDTVGGVYGQRKYQFKGQHPSRSTLIIVSDSVKITSQFPTTNLYPQKNGLEAHREGTSGADTLQTQMIYKADRTFSALQFLGMPQLIQSFSLAYSGSAASLFGCTIKANIEVIFLTVALDIDASNPYGLDEVTWNTGNYPNGSLYSDAANYDGPYLIDRISSTAFTNGSTVASTSSSIDNQLSQGYVGASFGFSGDTTIDAGKVYTGFALAINDVSRSANGTGIQTNWQVSASHSNNGPVPFIVPANSGILSDFP